MSLQPLLDAILGQSQQIANDAQQPPSWQNELIQTVDPERQRKESIRRALAQASMALASTPGNFLQGVAAAAGTGANSYLQSRENDNLQRVKTMQLIQQAQRQDQDRRLRALMDAFGVQQRQQAEQADAERAERDFQYRRNIDDRNFDYRQQQDDRIFGYRTENDAANREARQTIADTRSKAAPSSSAGRGLLTEKERNRRAAARDYAIWLRNRQEDQFAPPVTEEEKTAVWDDLRQKYNVTEDGATEQEAPQVQNPATGKDAKADNATVLQQARDAIARGADPAAVRQRMIDNGYDPTGL